MPRRDVPLIVPIVDWRAIEDRVCTRKHPYDTGDEARRARGMLVRRVRDDAIRVYPCPFARSQGLAAHYHLGHVPDLAGLRRIAAALRAKSAEVAERDGAA